MKITPIEIRQKVFEKKLRGYDKDEVQAFLQSLSNEWERVLDENKENKIKLDQAKKEVQKLREVENSLFKTLKTAEDTGANLVEQANKAAELHLKEVQINAEALIRESKSKASAIIEQAELQAKEMIDEMQEAVKDLEKNYRSIENQRDNLLRELKNLSADIMERLDRNSRQPESFKVEDHMKRVKSMVRESEQRIKDQKLEINPPVAEKIPSLDPKDADSTKKLESFLKSREEAKSPSPVAEEVPVKKAAPEAASLMTPVQAEAKAQEAKNGDAARKKAKLKVRKTVLPPPETQKEEEEGGSFFDSL